MLGRFPKPSPALIVACVALLVALGGTSVAAVKALAPRNSVGSAQVINKSLLPIDFKTPPKGPRGLAGPPGPAGPAGPAGAAALGRALGEGRAGGAAARSAGVPRAKGEAPMSWLEEAADVWWSWMAPVSAQVAVIALGAALVERGLGRRAWPQLRAVLWLTVMAKLVVPPGASVPVVKWTVLVPASKVAPFVAETKTMPSGNTSLTVAPVTVLGPLLVTMTV